jgi:hypothetical protein
VEAYPSVYKIEERICSFALNIVGVTTLLSSL